MRCEPNPLAERTVNAEAAERSPVWGGRPTLEVFTAMIDQFAQHLRFRGLSPNTVRRRNDTLRQFTQFLNPLPLERATEELVEEFLGSKPTARTRHAYRSDLRVFYAWALKHGLVDADPAVGLDRIKVPKSLPRPLDVRAAEATLLFGSRRVRRMIGLALYAGFRCHEIAALQAEDVRYHGKPAVIVVREGKGGKDRTIRMHPNLVALLSDLPPSGAVFPGRDIPTMQPMSVSKAIRAHLLAAGIDGTAHQLRHTFGTEVARATGGNMNITAKVMGHESMNTTMGYVQLAQSDGGDVIERLYMPDDAA